ncbi:MAG: hypothetical protein VX874_00550 [Pseudomonadota bacterium]|nr:hypothetical protein [Pseudomonadota bacterium]
MDRQTVLITGARAPVALHMARLMGSAGLRVILTDTMRRPLGAATKFARYERLPSPVYDFEAFGDALTRLIAREGVSLVIPTCEEVFHLARLWEGREMAAPLFAPDMARLAEVHSKAGFIALCATLGLDVPETTVLTSISDLDAVRGRAGTLVFKPVWSRFAEEVLIRPHPRGLDAITPSRAKPWVAQAFVAGDEVSVYAMAQEGRLLALSAYRALARAGTGAAVAFAPVAEAAVTDFVERFVAGTGWTGQVSFDLMRQADGSVLPLECNPRAVSGLHFFRDGPAFLRMLEDGAPVRPDVSAPQGVRLALWVYGLPKAIASGQLAAFRETVATTQEVLDWPDDPGARWAQVPAMVEVAGVALRQRMSLLSASTYDIEWNGPDQSSIR